MGLDRAFFDTWTPRALSLLRIVAAFMFLQHGIAKYFAIPHVAQFDNTQLWTLSGIGGVIEMVGGTLLLLGLFTRPVAFILSGEMAVAYFIGHALKTGPLLVPILNRGELAAQFHVFANDVNATQPCSPRSPDTDGTDTTDKETDSTLTAR